MIATIILGIFSVIFAYIAKYENTKWGLKVSFTLIFLFLALRYNFGNDYKTYLDNFIDISGYDDIRSYENTQRFEMGWVYLNWLFRYLGFFCMTAVLALVNCIVYYLFIKKYVPARYYWLAVFIYIFYPEFMLIHSSAMRQSIAIILFIFSLDYLCKKDAIRYFLCIGLATLFHTTALILLPVYLLGLFDWRFGKVFGVIFVSIYVSVFILVQSLSPLVKLFISNYFDKYMGYQDEGVFSSGFGIVYFSIMFILMLYFSKLQNRETAIVFNIAIIGYMFMPLTLIIGLTGRLGMYFAPATIIAYPIIFMNIKKPTSKTVYVTLLLIATTYKFFQFFYSDTYKDDFGTYQTILSSSNWY